MDKRPTLRERKETSFSRPSIQKIRRSNVITQKRTNKKRKLSSPYDEITKKTFQPIYTASLKISKFMKTRKNRITAIYLNTVCSNEGECMAFGNENERINKLFKSFVDFSLLTQIRRIGEPSVNGFINELKYENMGFTSYAVLKSSLSESSDNLTYEWIVGTKFINYYSDFFSCFLKTYEIFTYQHSYDKLRLNNNQVKPEELKALQYDFDAPQTNHSFYNGFMAPPPSKRFPKQSNKNSSNLNLYKINPKNDDDLLKMVCDSPELLCLLIQHLHNPKTMYDLIRDAINSDDVDEYLSNYALPVLFQVYHALASLSEVYTHYDLHGGNVLLYQITKDGQPACATFRYHFRDGTTFEFESPYIAKIIDYGRCFFIDPQSGTTSTHFLNWLCSNNCIRNHRNVDCNDNGFFINWQGGVDIYGSIVIDSTSLNKTSDLTLLASCANLLKPHINKISYNSFIMTFLRFSFKPYENSATVNHAFNIIKEKLKGKYTKLELPNVGTLEIYDYNFSDNRQPNETMENFNSRQKASIPMKFTPS